MNERRRQSDQQTIMDKWWHFIRPFWHIATFLIICTFIASTKWSTVQAYGDTLLAHEKRLTALEIWQAGASNNIASMKQEIDDIHEAVVGDDKNRRNR
jgi:hypothetical protein